MWKHASLNRRYRLVWNRVRQRWSVAPEIACGQGKAAAGASEPVQAACILPLRALVVAIGCAFSLPVLALDAGALPTGGNVVAGQASLSQSGNTLTVNQSTDRTILEWQSFNIGKDAAVHFNQNSASSVALNRVTGGTRSEIYGSLTANGQVYLVNSAGVLFGSTAQVDVGGIVASTLDISNDDFLAGKNRFVQGSGTGDVINQGSITARDGGTVALIGSSVSNTGQIVANGGNVALAAGQQVTFAAGANGHLQIAVDATEAQAQVHNGGLIQADGGQVILTAQGANALASAVVSNTGTIQARTVAEREGKILLLADFDSGTTQVAGTLDASAPDGSNGGFIETSAANVTVADSTKVTTKATDGQTGTWLIDPNDFTVAASGGDMSGATVAANLANTNFTIETATMGTAGGNGDIHINDAISWSTDTTLILNAERNINVNAAITATGTNAGLALNYGGTNGSSSATPASGSDYNVKAPITLSGGGSTLSINGNAYTLIRTMDDLAIIDSTGAIGNYALANDLDASGTVYNNPLIAMAGINPFSGTFAGLGHTISNLTISVGTSNYLALFGQTGSSSVIRDIGLVGGSMTGNANNAGMLVGYNKGSIRNAYATGSVSAGQNHVGGLVGFNDGGSISNAYATGNVSGRNDVGGLVGFNYNNGTINNTYATGNVSGSANYVGGLVGFNESASISNSYATGTVSGGTAGALVGANAANGTVTASFWLNSVSGTGFGWQSNTSTIDSFTRGLSDSEATSASTYIAAGWSASNTGGSSTVWRIYDGYTGPLLRSFMTELTVTAGNASKSYDGTTAFSTSYTLSDSGADTSLILGTAAFTTSSKNVGSYGLGINGLYSGQQGYDISFVDGSATISAATLTVSGTTAANKTYDGTAVAMLNGSLNGLVSGDAVTLSQTGTFDDKNAATGKTVNYTSSVSGADAGNYVLVSGSGTTTADITAAALTVSSSAANKTYDGTADATLTGSLSGVVSGDVVTLSQNGTFSDKNAATGKTVSYTSSISGADAANYVLASNSGTTTADITAATLTVSGSTVANKTYDGTTVATVSGGTLSGVIGSDSVLLGSQSGTFSDKNAGTGKTVAIATSLSGTDAGNYVVAATSTTADITAATLSVSGTTAANKTYDGNDGAVVSGSLGGVVVGDAVTLSQSGSFSDKNAATGKTVTYTNSLSGADAGNYVLASGGGTTTANINQAALTISGITASDKTYNGSNAATVNTAGAVYGGLIAGDVVAVSATGQFSDKNAGTGKTVTLTSSYSGADAGNYAITSQAATTATIQQASLTVGSADVTKTYDGTNGATGTAVVTNGTLFGSDSVSGGSFAFTDVNAGTGKTVTVSGVTISDGNSGGNYDVTYVDNTASTINKAGITVTANGGTSTYGDTGLLNPGLTVSGLVNGQDESVLTGLSNSFAIDNTTNAGSHTLTVNGTLSNGNYVVIQAVDGTWVVDPKAITVAAASGSSTYGDTGVLNPGFIATGLVNGQDESVLTGLFNSFAIDNTSNAGSYVLTVNGTLTNSNYFVTQTANGTWNVDRKVLTVQANSDSRTASPSEIYSGGNGVTYSGFVNGEDSSVLLGSLSYGGSAQGASRAGTYSLSVSGLSADNYAIQYVDGRLLLTSPVNTPSGGELEKPVRGSLDRSSPLLMSMAQASAQPLHLTIMSDPISAAD